MSLSSRTSNTRQQMVLVSLLLCPLFFLISGANAFQEMPLLSKHIRQPTTSRLYYANAPPLSEKNNNGNSFEDRMRDLVSKQKKQRSQQQQQQRAQRPPRKHAFGKRPSFLKQVTTLQDYKSVVVDESERISVVRFYATFCRSCKAATPAFDAMASKYPELNWVEVPVSQETATLHQALGVPSVPFGHIYSPTVGLVEEVRLVRPEMGRVSKILESYVEGKVDLPERVDPETGIYEAPF